MTTESNTNSTMSEDTTFATLPPAEPSGRSWHHHRWAKVLGAVMLAAFVIGVAGFFVPAEWVGRIWPGNSLVDDGAVVFRPGSARGVGERITVDGADVFSPNGEILFTTVSIDDQVSVWDWVGASVDDEVELRDREVVFGDRSVSENRERNLQLMQASKDAAVLVALERLGLDVVDVSGVGFEATVDGAPADGLLESGDVIVAIDGETVTDLASLRALLDVRPPGTAVVVTVEHFETGEQRDVGLVLGTHPDEETEGGFIGIEGVQERVTQLELPFDVDIDSGSVGGPSAGLAFALSIIDLLTPGELTGGAAVAVTGTISFEGAVGNVGGVAQKAAAAHDAGAVAFLVPEESLEAARSTAGDMAVVGVGTLDDALEALSDLGGSTNELALGPLDG